MADYYKILGVGKEASDDQIKKAYRKVAMKYHPDRNAGDATAEGKFKAAAEAYEVLSSPDKRARYDQFGKAGFNGGQFSGAAGGFGAASGDAFHIFREFMSGFGNLAGFEDFFGGGSRSFGTTGHGSDMRVKLGLTYEEIASGAEKTIRIKRHDRCKTCGGSGAAGGSGATRCSRCGGSGEIRQVQRTMLGQMVNLQPCRHCQGSGQVIERPCRQCHGDGRQRVTRDIKVMIPTGVSQGNYMTLSGEGNIGYRGAPAGDLIVIFGELQHPIFLRHSSDILLSASISFAEAALGTSLEIPTLDGKANMKIPAGIQAGHVLRLRGKGFPVLNGHGRGDQLVKIQVVSPERLSSEMKDLYGQLLERETAIEKKRRYGRFTG